jgi:hypothetical protein
MPTTTNYGWTTPADTDLVKDGASAIRTLGTAIDTTVFNNANAAIAKTIVDAKGDIIAATASDTVARLAVGSNEQRLVADSAQTSGLKYVADTTNYAIAAKGDLLVGTAADTLAALSVGANGYTLVADSAESVGMRWAAPTGGLTLIEQKTLSAVSSVQFASIPSTYKQLMLVWFGVKHSANGSNFNLRLNNDSTAGIYMHAQWGQTGNTVTNDRGDYSSIGLNGAAPFGDDASEAAIYQSAAGEFIIDNYASTSVTKSFFGRWTYKDNAANAAMYGQLIGSYNSTSAITTIDVVRMTGTATLSNQTNTTVRLYGLS